MAALSRIEADYLIETPVDPRTAAETMAGEQSSGTFVAVPGETSELKERAAARVENIELLDEISAPSLPVARPINDSGPWRRARVTLSWPLDNIGPSLPNLMATVAGNLWELRQLTGLRLLDLRLPLAFAANHGGPKFGVAGTRRLADVSDRPLIGTIIKPSIGLSPAETADLVATLCDANVDFIKDDELQSDGAYCPFDLRVRAVMHAVNRHADRSGKKVMFAEGGTCVMASINSIGLVGMIELGRHAQLPIHAHRNGWGVLNRHPSLGFEFTAWQKIWRLAGADHMHVNGIGNKFSETDASVIVSARACLTPIFDEKPCVAMPVFSSGQSAKQASQTHAALGSTDLIFAAGGGILAHPNGPAAGVAELRAAWDAAISGNAPRVRP